MDAASSCLLRYQAKRAHKVGTRHITHDWQSLDAAFLDNAASLLDSSILRDRHRASSPLGARRLVRDIGLLDRRLKPMVPQGSGSIGPVVLGHDAHQMPAGIRDRQAADISVEHETGRIPDEIIRMNGRHLRGHELSFARSQSTELGSSRMPVSLTVRGSQRGSVLRAGPGAKALEPRFAISLTRGRMGVVTYRRPPAR